MDWNFVLASMNATLNGTAAILLFLGYRAIRNGQRDTHRKLMSSAFLMSALFLVGYLTRMIVFGDKKFEGTGALRPVYFTILISHVILAIISLPLILTTLYRASKEEFERHRKLARITFPMWAYVSVTGVIVYLMLYHVA
ncbi:MAG: DUF420 domain-containing protein [Planctomycetota bacterium]|jgi:putative membrane protein